MTIAAGPFAIGAFLLVLGGALKAIRPGDTANAVRSVGVPIGPMAVRAGAGVEMAIGIYALVAGDRPAAVLVALSYAAFAVFVGVALARRLPIATCGCFGRADTPPSLSHLFVNLGAVVAATAVAVDPGAGIPDAIADQPLAGVPYLLLVVVGTYLAYVALTTLPRTIALVRISRDGA